MQRKTVEFKTADWLIKKVTEAICEWCRCLIIYVTQAKEEGNIVMGIKSRYEYLKEILLRYKYATRAQKKNILDEFCTNCGYNRKYAIRLLNSNKSKPKKVSKRGRKKFYHDPLIAQVLSDIWVPLILPVPSDWKPWFHCSCHITRNISSQKRLKINSWKYLRLP